MDFVYLIRKSVLDFAIEDWILCTMLCGTVIIFVWGYLTEKRMFQKPANVAKLPNKDGHQVWEIKFDKKDGPH